MTVLVAYDGSAPAQKAVKRAFDTYPDEEIVLLRVVEVGDSLTKASLNAVQEMLGDRRERTAEDLRTEIADLVTADTVDFQAETATGNPAKEVVEYAEEHDIDHIIVGSHGRKGVSRVLLGSVAEQIVRRAPVTVTVVR
ncbi:universal stress protein [Natronorubrum sp. JWXQ-INN-674]|uniref:Universal stress protein n=1 Tax=Natronorubrum halalkaliphilum TaxID=2691917 RepID=A0A6B0VMN4_9EURY|nr:universal stress protein [Natronorubrum halalkaliphilum]MXV62840.1 universal stress protein [Natronorubrum halalkaliphilum]